MKKIILITFLLSLNLLFSQNISKTDLENDNLKGLVKNLRYKRYKRYEAIDRFGKITLGRIYQDELKEYNNKGYNISTTIFKTDGTIQLKFIKKYNNKNQFIENITYDENGKCFGIFKRVYDNSNNLASTKSYKCDGLFDGSFLYDYDGRGNNIFRTQIMADNEKDYLSYKYDVNNNLTESRWYVNNPEKNLGKLQFKDDIGYYSSRKYEYNSSKKLEREININAFGAVNSISIYKTQDDYIEEIYNENNKTGEIEHKNIMIKYDKNKNWTEKVFYENGIAKQIVTRIINYY